MWYELGKLLLRQSHMIKYMMYLRNLKTALSKFYEITLIEHTLVMITHSIILFTNLCDYLTSTVKRILLTIRVKIFVVHKFSWIS